MGPVTRILIASNAAVFALQYVLGDWLVATFALWPLGRYPVDGTSLTAGFHFWQLATSAFLHGGVAHIALNMFALWMFGRDVERLLGSVRYFAVYAAAVLSSALVQLLVVTMAVRSSGDVYPTIGASGGVFGVLLAFGMLFPRRIVMLLFPPIPMPARVFVVVYAGIELASGVFGTSQGIAHFAHLGGMVGAYAALKLSGPRTAYRSC